MKDLARNLFDYGPVLIVFSCAVLLSVLLIWSIIQPSAEYLCLNNPAPRRYIDKGSGICQEYRDGLWENVESYTEYNEAGSQVEK